MTPEDFRNRATAAVSTVEPDGRSYAWLTRNVARRTRARRLTWGAAATSAVAVAGVAVAVVPGDDARPPVLGASPTVTAEATPTPTTSPTPSPTATPVGAPGDVDGDGRPDDVRIVNGTPWRVEVRGSAGKVLTLAIPPNVEDGDSRAIAGVADVNGDGRGEVFVRLSWKDRPDHEYLGVTLVRGTTLAWVLDDLNGTGPLRLRHAADRLGWGCLGHGADLFTITIETIDRGTAGMVNRFNLIDARAVPLDSFDQVWDAGTPYPPEYRTEVRCGPLVVAAPGSDPERPPPAPVASDIDGDSLPDEAQIVERGSRAKRTWQWGVRANMTTLGPQTVWHPVMASSNEAQSLEGIVDVNGDGRAEVSVSPGGTAFGKFYDLYTVVDGRLVKVEGPVLAHEKRPDEMSGWGCDMGRVAVAVANTSDGGRTWRGTITYYSLVYGGKLVEKDKRTQGWSTPSGIPPAVYTSDGC